MMGGQRLESSSFRPLFPLRGGVCSNQPDCFTRPPEPQPGRAGLILLFLGANSLYLSDGQSHLLIDPYLSRPHVSLLSLALGGRRRIRSNPARIRRTLEAAGIQAVTAIVITHAHYDHALDAAATAQIVGASQGQQPVIYGSSSVVNIALGGGVTDDRLVAISPEYPDGVKATVGDFRLTFLASHHMSLPVIGVPFPGLITTPLSQSAPASAYRAGHVFSLHVVHSQASFFIQGSAGLLRERETAPQADYLVLPIAGVDFQSGQWRHAYQRRVIAAAGPKAVFFSHWDDYHRSLEKPPAWIAGRPGRGPAASLAYFRNKQPELSFSCLPIGSPLYFRRVGQR